MQRRSLLAGAAALGLAAPSVGRAQARTEIQFWHAMPGVLGEIVAEQVKRFNDSQGSVTVIPSFKGSYTDAMTGAIAAWRAGNPPHIVQVFGRSVVDSPAFSKASRLIHMMAEEELCGMEISRPWVSE